VPQHKAKQTSILHLAFTIFGKMFVMRRYFLYIVVFIFAGYAFFACGDSETNDREPPRIVEYSIDDTLYIDSIGVNIFSGSFSDNEALSSFKIQLTPKFADGTGGQTGFTLKQSLINSYGFTDTFSVAKDSCVLLKYVSIGTNIFGKDTAIVKNYSFIIPAYYQLYDPATAKNIDYKVRTGIYKVMIACMDRAGNYDSIPFPEQKEIVLLYNDIYYQ